MITIYIIGLILTLVFGAYFSACETAITGSSKARIHQLAKEGDQRAIIIRSLQHKIGLVISVILTCNTMINAFGAGLATDLFNTWYASLIMGGFILIYAEVMPKMVAILYPEKFILSTAKLLLIIFNILRPINYAINWVSRKTLGLFGIKTTDPDQNYEASVEELKGAIDLHVGPAQDVEHEKAMLKSILDLARVKVEEIMVHRKNVTMLNVSEPASTIVDQVLSCPFTRLPLYRDNPDNIIGIINAKALLRAVRAHSGNIDELNIEAVALKPWFVPESTDLLDQLQAFRLRREHFAMVVDEYGSLLGIVTLEDILEEIVGDITDEHDIAVRGVRPQPDGSFIVDGSVTLRDINRQLHWNLPDEQASTIAGFILYQTRIIPEIGQIFSLNGFRFEILRRQRNQITLVKVSRQSLEA